MTTKKDTKADIKGRIVMKLNEKDIYKKVSKEIRNLKYLNEDIQIGKSL